MRNKSEKQQLKMGQLAMNVCDVREEKQVWLLVQMGHLLVSKVVVALAKEFSNRGSQHAALVCGQSQKVTRKRAPRAKNTAFFTLHSISTSVRLIAVVYHRLIHSFVRVVCLLSAMYLLRLSNLRKMQ